ncbi:MAG: ABC transporter substrate-binding protein [Propionibacteriaceae bacterium]|nr:ABC transporter substrate-binding protein [Propionibacteriaceae bacterium]
MRTFARLLAPLAALALLGTGCASTTPTDETPSAAATTVTIDHAQGAATLPQDPASVVVLDYASLDTLNELGLSDRVTGVANGTLPETLSVYADVERIGSSQEPDIEAIAALDPDAIIISGRSSAKYAELNEVAPTIDLSSHTYEPVEVLTNSVTALGRLFAVEDAAQAELDEVTALIEATRAGMSTENTGLILMTTGGKLSAYGPGARFGSLIHDALGVPAAAPDLSREESHGQAVSFEFLAETNPGALYVIDRDAAIGQQGDSAQQLLDNPLVHRTDAWTHDRVTYLDGGSWYIVGYGLANTKSMINDVAGTLAS